VLACSVSEIEIKVQSSVLYGAKGNIQRYSGSLRASFVKRQQITKHMLSLRREVKVLLN